jgi:hypothetical protein
VDLYCWPKLPISCPNSGKAKIGLLRICGFEGAHGLPAVLPPGQRSCINDVNSYKIETHLGNISRLFAAKTFEAMYAENCKKVARAHPIGGHQ